MVCRHRAGDSNCSSSPENQRRAGIEAEAYRQKKKLLEERKKRRDALTPDADKYEIKQFTRVNRLVVMQVQYPNCDLCAHDGVKIMVFENMTEMEMIQLKRIDPHFRPKTERVKSEARTPIARFPGDDQGWKDAILFAKAKTK